MSLQTLSQIVILIGVILTAVGGFGTYYYGKKENDTRDKATAVKEQKLQSKITDLQQKLKSIDTNTASIDEKINLIVKSNETKKHKWNEAKVIAPAIADYILLIFRSSDGKIAGHVRIKGRKEIYPFSTQVNNSTPLAVHNLWLAEKKQYQTDPILEYEITDTSDEKNILSIFTSGFKMSSGF